jgi:orotate phosphoribosyltransferase
MMRHIKLIRQLHEIGAIKFGQFTLKSGIASPIYINLRLIVSYPKLLQEMADAIWEQIDNRSFDVICGVPYTALPIATYLSLKHNIPMVMRRKETKDYGTRTVIEGVIHPGDRCLIIEDLVTSASSILETIRPLEDVQLKIKDVAVFLDREQGGKRLLEERGYCLSSVIGIHEFLDTLADEGLLDKSIREKTLAFIHQNQFQETSHVAC